MHLGHSLSPAHGAALHFALDWAALFVAGLIYWRRGNAASQPPQRLSRWSLLAGAAVGAAVGARALYVLQYWPALEQQPLSVWWGGKTIVGGLLGALIGVEIAKLRIGWRASTGDGFVLPLIAAMIIGRIGCQFSGISDLTYGAPTSLPWGWDYGDGVERHPTALYEILAVIVLAGITRLDVFSKRSGDHFKAFLFGYLALRLGLDFLKPPFGASAIGALSPAQWGPLSPIQWACLLGMTYYSGDVARWISRRTPTGG